MQSPRYCANSLTLATLASCVVLLGLAATPVRAQDHDLVMLSPIVADPNPLDRGCTNSLAASFRINGVNDHELDSGQVKIQFHWSDGSLTSTPSFPSAQWNSIGEMSATYNTSDGSFAVSRTWPDDFPSAAGTTRSWTPPSTPTSFYVRAEVSYVDSAIADFRPADNSTVTRFDSVAGVCSGPPGCVGLAGKRFLFCGFEDLIRIPVECLKDPLKPCKPFVPFPPLCGRVPCPPCLTGLSCPGPWFELFFDNRMSDLRITLVDQKGVEVANMESLKRPRRFGRRTFNQRLRFQAEKGVRYFLRVSSGERTDLEAGYELPLLLRPGGH